MLYSIHFISCSSFPLIIPIICAGILLYDYCLTFIAEVERCWGVRRLNWSLGFFYLNRYLTPLGYIPIMLNYFWTSETQIKLRWVSCYSKSRSWDEVERYWCASSQMLVFIHVWHSKIAMIPFFPVVPTCICFNYTSLSSLRWPLLVGLFFWQILLKNTDFIFLSI